LRQIGKIGNAIRSAETSEGRFGSKLAMPLRAEKEKQRKTKTPPKYKKATKKSQQHVNGKNFLDFLFDFADLWDILCCSEFSSVVVINSR